LKLVSKCGRSQCHDWESQWQKHDGRVVSVVVWKWGSGLYWCDASGEN